MSSIRLNVMQGRLGKTGKTLLMPVLLAGALCAAVAIGVPNALAQETATPPVAAPEETTQPQQPPALEAPSTQAPSTQTPSVQAPSVTEDMPASEAELPVLMQEEAGSDRDATLPHDLSPWGMFMAADWVVKAVMIGLAFASLVTWTVWIAKSLELAGATTRGKRALDGIVSAHSLKDAGQALSGRKGPAALMVRAAAHEVAASEETLDYGGGDGLKERVSSHLARIQAQAARRMTRGTGILATIGSTAPFVGLFGTVWGIMNSFIGISEAQTTNLAIVAPGIAEALLATALGLVAAIPAVVIYNVFARSIAGYRLLLSDAAAAVERLISRDLDHRLAGPARRKIPTAAE